MKFRDNISDFFYQYKSIMLYLFFGGCTTIINIVVYNLLYTQWGLKNVVSTIVANIICIIVAYITNRRWVFEHVAETRKGIIREIVSFFSCRMGTLLLDIVFMFVFVDISACNADIMKFLSNVLIVIVNYVASKILVFNKKHSNNME